MTQHWAGTIVNRLLAAGVGHFFISPGSRSTPLVVAVMESGADYTIHFDERGASFAALGYSLQSEMIAAWITTSGTAVANGFPAIVEASVSGIPLVLLTADRPPELRDAGSNQTIDQVKLFGEHVRKFVDVPAPTTEISSHDLASIVGRAMRYVRYPNSGPVHINCMFRKPLEPTQGEASASVADSVSTSYIPPRVKASSSNVERLHSILSESNRPLFVVGSLEQSAARRVAELAESTGAVVFADARSGLRTGNPFSPNVVAYQDLVLQSSEISMLVQPDVVLMFGERMTSRHVYDYVDSAKVKTIRVTDSPSIVDPSRNLWAEIICDVASLCDDIVDVADGDLGSRDLDYLEYWTRLSGHAENILDAAPQINSELTEPAIARAITKLLPSESCFHVSSSMPIRDVDTFGLRRSKVVSITSNRGASGIDGTIATARGVQIGGGRTTTIFTGDLAFLHDLNSLALARDDSPPFIIVVVNNDGGGIFSMLPISEHQKYFEEGFGTPHGYSFEFAARLFRYDYQNPETLSEFESAYLRATTSDSPTIIEVATRRDENVHVHEKLRELVRTEVAKISNH